MATELARKIRGTRRKLGAVIRSQFIFATDAGCEPLILDDLKKGDKFIIMPPRISYKLYQALRWHTFIYQRARICSKD